MGEAVKRKPKFKVGQVVHSGKASNIMGDTWNVYARVAAVRQTITVPEYRLQNKDFWYGEYNLRPLTKKECGR